MLVTFQNIFCYIVLSEIEYFFYFITFLNCLNEFELMLCLKREKISLFTFCLKISIEIKKKIQMSKFKVFMANWIFLNCRLAQKSAPVSKNFIRYFVFGIR